MPNPSHRLRQDRISSMEEILLCFGNNTVEQRKVTPANQLGTFPHGLPTLPSGGPPASPFRLGDSAMAGTFAHLKHRLAVPSRPSDWAIRSGRGLSPIPNADRRLRVTHSAGDHLPFARGLSPIRLQPKSTPCRLIPGTIAHCLLRYNNIFNCTMGESPRENLAWGMVPIDKSATDPAK